MKIGSVRRHKYRKRNDGFISSQFSQTLGSNMLHCAAWKLATWKLTPLLLNVAHNSAINMFKHCEDSTDLGNSIEFIIFCENICNEASPGCFSLSSSYALALHKTPGAPSTHLTHNVMENLKPNFRDPCSSRFVLYFLRWTCRFVAFVS